MRFCRRAIAGVLSNNGLTLPIDCCERIGLACVVDSSRTFWAHPDRAIRCFTYLNTRLIASASSSARQGIDVTHGAYAVKLQCLFENLTMRAPVPASGLELVIAVAYESGKAGGTMCSKNCPLFQPHGGGFPLMAVLVSTALLPLPLAVSR